MSRPRTRKSVKESCDRLWSKLVRARAGWCCERCGVEPEAARGFHAHHIYGRSNHRLRFEPRNGTALCGACHRWAEEVPVEFTDWLWRERRADVNWLRSENRKGLIRRSLVDYIELESELKAQLEAIELSTRERKVA